MESYRGKMTELEESVLTFLKGPQTAVDMQNLMLTMVKVHRFGSGLIYIDSCAAIERAYTRNLEENLKENQMM